MATQHYCARYWSPIDAQVAAEFSATFADEVMRHADGDNIFIAIAGCGGVRFDQLLISSRAAVCTVQRIPTPVRLSSAISAFVWARNRFCLRMRPQRRQLCRICRMSLNVRTSI